MGLFDDIPISGFPAQPATLLPPPPQPAIPFGVYDLNVVPPQPVLPPLPGLMMPPIDTRGPWDSPFPDGAAPITPPPPVTLPGLTGPVGGPAPRDFFADIPVADTGLTGVMRNYLTSMNPALPPDWTPSQGGMPPVPVAPPVVPVSGPAGGPVPPAVDQSSALGDLMAGWLQLQQFMPGRAVSGAITDITNLDEIDPAAGEFPLVQPLDPLTPEQEAALARRRDEEMLRAGQDLATGAARIADLNEQIADIPMNPAASDMMAAETFPGAVSEALNDPLGVLRTFGLRSIPASIPTIAGAVAGQAVGGPIGAALLAGGASLETERALSIAQDVSSVLQQAGVDPNDPAALQALVTANPDEFRDILKDALTRGGIIAGVDALTAGVVGRLARATEGMSPLPRAGTAFATGTLIEPPAEGAGEALAQLATDGQINPGDVLAETLGGLATGGVTATGQAVAEFRNTPSIQPPATPDPAPLFPAAPVAPNEPEEPVVAPPSPAPEVSVAPPEAPPTPQTDAPPQIAAEPPVEQAAAPLAPRAPNPERVTTVYTPDNEPVEVETMVVEATDLLTSDQDGYPMELQPRDRDRAASQAQIQAIAGRPVPARLDQSPESDRGSPIVGPDGSIVESGNGRVMGLRLAYERGTAEEYRAYVQSRYPEAAGMQNPVIVRRRLSDVNERDFTTASNQSATLALSATEQAQADARLVDGEVLSRYRGGLVESAGNRDMIRAFVGKLPQAAQGALVTKDGGLTIDGQRRFQQAVFARAYGDDRLLTRMAESMDDDTRSITQALVSQAPKVAQLRQAIDDGQVDPETMQVIDATVRAIQQIHDFRSSGQNLTDFRRQIDAFADPVPAIVDRAMDAFFNPAGTRVASKKDMEDFLSEVVDLAMQERIDQTEMLDARESRSPEEIVDEAQRRVRTGGDDTGTLFDGGPADGAGSAERRQAQRQRTDGARGAEDADRLADAGAARREGVGRKPGGGLSPRFLDFSYNNRESVFQSALADAGIDAESARTMRADEQIKRIVPMIERKYGVKVRLPTIKVQTKNRFGRRVTEERTSITSREALDQLLDAYQNMQMLAAIMQVPTTAIGLPIDGKGLVLSLVGNKAARGTLGMFSWGNGERVITLPGRSNSFAHEWGHALDHFLNQSLDKPHLKGMLTRNMAGVGVTKPMSPKMLLTEAFADLMWAMFGDSTNLAALRVALQVQAAQIGADGKPTDAAKNATRIINMMREGRKPPEAYLGQYFRNAEAFDRATGQQYFADPAEMFARAFEAWVGRTVGAMTDLPQSFLSKGNWAYDTNTDERLRMTFPKGTDADRFAIAMTQVTQVMGNLGMFTGEKATAPLNTAISSNNSLLQEVNKQGLIGQERAAMTRFIRNIKALEPSKLRADRKAENYFPVVWNTLIATQAHMMTLLAERQRTPEAREALMGIVRQVAKVRPGSGEFLGAIYQEEVESTAKRRIQKLQGALYRHFAGGALSQADKEAVRNMLIGRPSGRETAPQRALAADIRSLLSEAWYDLKAAGIKVAYQDGYLPRIYDPVAVDRDRAGFRAKAREVYQVYFDREVRENDDEETQNADIKTIITSLRNATAPIPDGTREPAPRLSEDDEALIVERQKARAKLRSLQKQQDKSDDPAKFQDAIDKAIATYEDLNNRVMDMLSDRWTDYSAENWETGIGVGRLDDVGSVGPSSNFLEGRVLPPEADEIMAPFMQDDPIDLIQGYFFASARRAEYAKRFGDDNSKLNNMLEAARKGGATEQELSVMKAAMRGATGRIPAAIPGWSRATSVLMVWGTLKTMGLSAFTSLAEPMVTAARTGRARDGLAAVVEQIMLIPRKQRRQRLSELARAVGMIAPYTMETVMENRMNADAMTMPKLAEKALNRFFILNGLTPLTNFQRVAGIPIANAHILRALRDDVRGERTINSRLRDPIAGGRGAFSNDELNELGIAKADRVDLLAWLEGLPDNLPRNDDLWKPDGNAHMAAQIWMRAINRLVSETIQNPLKTDRPLAANSPDLAPMYSIMSFITAFTRNVIFRSLGRGIDLENDTLGTKAAKVTGNAALAILPFASLYMAHLVTTVIREAILNTDKLEAEWEEDREAAITWLMERAFSRTGLTGRLDLLIQMTKGVRYDRDLTSLTAGAYIGSVLQDVQTISEAFFGRNSENTNTAEFNAAQATYRLIVQPAIALGLTLGTPGGRLTDTAAGVGLIHFSSYDASVGFAERLVGEKGGGYEGDPPWWELAQ